MATASIRMADGTMVTIEGSTEEVATLIARLSGPAAAPARAGVRSGGGRNSARRPSGGTGRPKPKGPKGYIRELIAEEFFVTPQGLGDVRRKLEERAQIYPVTTLSPALYRLVRDRELRRIKKNDQWVYVNA